MNTRADLSLDYDTHLAQAMGQSLDLLSLPNSSRKRVFKNAGRQYLKASRNHIRQQRTVEGKAMEKKKYGRGKALKNMGKNLKFEAGSRKVTLTWPNKVVAKVASKHQFGLPERFNSHKMQKIHGRPDYDQPASKKQAKALIRDGYTIATSQRYKTGDKKGKAKRKKPSIRHIQENMTLGHAGLIIRTLKGTEKPPGSWTIEVPRRAFLGVTPQVANDILASEIERERQRRTRS